MALLTKEICVKSVCPAEKSEITIFDDRREGVPGFGLRILSSGRKTWVFQYRFAGRKRRLTIGDFPAMGLLEARNVARQHRNAVRQGIDPAAAEEDAPRNTLEIFWEIYLQFEKKRGKKSLKQDINRWKRVIKPALGGLDLNFIHPGDIESIHNKIARTGPYEANRVLSLLSRLFTLAKRWGYMDQAKPNPCGFIERCKEYSRKDFYSIAELQAILAAADADSDPYARALIYIYVFTGKRKKEPLQCTWEDIYCRKIVNPETGDRFLAWFLNLKDTKSGRSEEVFLPDIVADLINDLPRLLDCPFIFPNVDSKKPLGDFPRWALKRMRKRCGIEFTIHKFRHTYATYLLGEGTSLEILARLLNQSTKAVTDRYAHLADIPKIAAGNTLANKLIILSNSKKKAD